MLRIILPLIIFSFLYKISIYISSYFIHLFVYHPCFIKSIFFYYINLFIIRFHSFIRFYLYIYLSIYLFLFIHSLPYYPSTFFLLISTYQLYLYSLYRVNSTLYHSNVYSLLTKNPWWVVLKGAYINISFQAYCAISIHLTHFIDSTYSATS